MKSPLTILMIAAFVFHLLPVSIIRANDLVLPKPGEIIQLSPAVNPPVLKGIKIHPENPFKFEFILSQGDEGSFDQQPDNILSKDEYFKQESTRLIKYFLAALTTPEKDMWVNLSPYEKDRIVPDSFGQTEMGRNLLAQDYLLKQITASLVYPEGNIGKTFWKKVYEAAQNKSNLGGNVSINTFNKVWIVPDKAVVYENAKTGTAYIMDSRLKVMTELDYLAVHKNNGSAQARSSRKDAVQKDDQQEVLMRDIVLPELTKEINEGANFTQLRQVYQSLILAAWFKKKVAAFSGSVASGKGNILIQAYVDRNKILGVRYDEAKDQKDKDLSAAKIYEQYLEAFKKGAYNYIKEEVDANTQQLIPRKYFAGGVNFDKAMSVALEISSDSQAVGRLLDKALTLLEVVIDAIKAPVQKATAVNKAVLDAETVALYLDYYVQKANPRTGFFLSHFGDSDLIRLYGTASYDLFAFSIAHAGQQLGLKIMNTFLKHVDHAKGENEPATNDTSGWVFSIIRTKGLDLMEWWNDRWEWRISAGDNAWGGIAALHQYVASRQVKYLKYAKERAGLLMRLQDKDGGIRYGPDRERYWKIKSAEHNLSALHLMDMLYDLTKDEKYKQTADRIYEWFITDMYDPKSSIFQRGAHYIKGQWVVDTESDFAPDVVSWAPLKRILEDARFGVDRQARLQRFEAIVAKTERLVGVYAGETLKGISFSPSTQERNIISIEWSSQFALLYKRIGSEYALLGDRNKTIEYTMKYDSLIKQLGGYFKLRKGNLVAPYAVYVNGKIAGNVFTGHGWPTPNAYASVISGIYYTFAKSGFDPLLLPPLESKAVVVAKALAAALGEVQTDNSNFTRGGIDLSTTQQLDGIGSGTDLQFNINPVMLEQIKNAAGFIPVIVNIRPNADIKFFLGI